MRRRTRFLVLALLGLGGCGGGDDPPAPSPATPPAARVAREPVGILLITIDTLRRDELGCYGYPRPTSPRIDALAAEGVLFEQAVAPMATTLPSHLSMLTGLYPHQHGIRSNRDAVTDPFVPGPGRRSAASFLADAGWRTAAFVSAPPLAANTGVADGFGVYDEPPKDSDEEAGMKIQSLSRTAARTAAEAQRWIREHAEPPFFLWVHLWDPHEPNAPPEHQLEAVRQGVAAAEVRVARGLDATRLPAIFAGPRLAAIFFDRAAKRVVVRGRKGEPPFEDALLDDLIDRYDADVRATDEAVGSLLDALEERGLARRTLVALTADHGQSLGDHDWLGHGRISATNVLVPLVLRFPPELLPQPARVSGTVSLVDLMPTLLARVPGEASRSLLAQAVGRDVFSGRFSRDWALVERTTSTIKETPPGPEHALVGERWKLVRRASDAPQLFDLEQDPAERHDVAAQQPELVRTLLAELERELASSPASGAGKAGRSGAAPSESARRQLEALEQLGYTGDDEEPSPERDAEREAPDAPQR